MNKIFTILFLLLFFVSVSFAQRVIETNMNDEEITSHVEEMSLRLEAAKSKKNKIAVYEEFAEMFFLKNVYNASSSIYIMLLEMNPSKKKKAEYYIKLGDIEAAKKRHNMSLEYYKNALALYKSNNEIKKKIGDILLESNLYSLAEQSFKDILAADKNSDYAKRKLGDIYYKQSRYSKALSYYEGVNHSHYDKELVINMATCYKSLNKSDKALGLVNNFIKTSHDSEMYLFAGFLYAGIGKVHEAEEQFLLSVQMDDNNFSSYIYLAAIYLENDNISKAEEMLDKARGINSFIATLDIIYAKISYKKGRIYEARRYAANAILKSKSPFVKRQAQKMLDFFNEHQK